MILKKKVKNKGFLGLSKKASLSIYKIWIAVASFSFVYVISMVVMYLIYIIGNDYIVYPLYDIFQNMTMYSDQIINASVLVAENYQNTNLGIIDLGFFLSYLLLIIGSFKMAYRTKNPDQIQFLSLLFYGIMLMIFVLGLIMILVNWIYSDILQVITSGMILDLPYFTYYLSHMGPIFLIHAVGLLLVNQMDFDYKMFYGRKKKEQIALSKYEEVF